MGKKTKKKYKIKHKTFGIISLIVLLLIGVTSYSLYHYISEEKTLKDFHKNFSPYITTTKKVDLYNEKKEKIGTISKNLPLELEENSNTHQSKFLKIKNTNYYITYKNIKKRKKEKATPKEESYYLNLQKKIKTSSNTILLKDHKEKITLNKKITLPVKTIDDQYYYIDFLNDTYQIKKSKKIKEIANEQEDNSFISVIYYEQIKEECDNPNCLTPNSINAHIKQWKENDYYFITKKDYEYYLKGYINLKEKAVLLITSEENECLKTIKEKNKVEIYPIQNDNTFHFEATNQKSTRKDPKEKQNCYQAKKYTRIDDYLKMAQGEAIEDDQGENNATDIPVVNYHFFYDAEIGDSCGESICLEAKKLEEHLKWLQENNYKTLTIYEFADWKDGIIELPKHSVLLTIDDGAKGTGAHNGNVLIPLLEKYQQHATLFLITGWWDLANYQSKYLDVQSHTDNLHFEAQCADGRGKVACSDYETVKKDLTQSLAILGGDNTSFCFPFYSYDNESLQALKDLNFRIAFIGGSRNAKRTSDNYLITRYPILSDITLQQFINIVK